jgi:hypothetical protein
MELSTKTTMRKPIEELIAERSGIRLDIGGGGNPQGPDWVNMDIRDLPTVDVVWDFEKIPWPLPDCCVTVAVASHVVEHVNPAKFGFINWMNELWRVMRYDGKVALALPHGYSPGYLQDPTHCNACNETTWAYFDPLEPNTQGMLYSIYSPMPWRIEFLAYDPSANIEVILVKRRWDESYGCPKPNH